MAPLHKMGELLVPRRGGGGHGGGGHGSSGHSGGIGGSGSSGSSSGYNGSSPGINLSPAQQAGIALGVVGALFLIGVLMAALTAYRKRNVLAEEKPSFGRMVWHAVLFATGLWVGYLLYYLLSAKNYRTKKKEEWSKSNTPIGKALHWIQVEKARQKAQQQADKAMPEVKDQSNNSNQRKPREVQWPI